MHYLKNFAKKIAGSLWTARTPTELILFVTERCNAKCRHCFIREPANPAQLSLEKVEKIAATLIEPINTLVITGGEPFMRPDLLDLVDLFARKKPPQTTIFCTNGSMTKRICDTIGSVLSKYPGMDVKVQISLDGLEEVHDEIRGLPGIFHNAVETIQAIKEMQRQQRNVDVIVMTVISTQNLGELAALNRFVTRELHAVHDFELIRGSSFFNIPAELRAYADPADDSCQCPTLATLREFLPTLREYYRANARVCYSRLMGAYAYGYKAAKIGYTVKVLERRKPVRCGAGREWGVIYASADISLCEMIKPIGNLADTSFNFSQLWSGDKARRARKALKCYCTHSCFIDGDFFKRPGSYVAMGFRFCEFLLRKD